MRLMCSIEISNLNAASQGFHGFRGKGVHSSLSVAKKAGGDVFLMWCTAKDKHGTKYKVKENVAQIFGRFVDEGKATVRLKDPNMDIRISKSNPVDLRRLLNAIKLAHMGDALTGKGVLSSTGPVQNKVITKPKTKLTVLKKKDYPLTEGFPSTLKSLTVNECNLSRFDSRMLKLRNLTSLDLSKNKIKEIPDALAQMHNLIELNLECNEISKIPDVMCASSSRIACCLRVMKLGNNQIRYLPSEFSCFKELYQLHLNDNQLSHLPTSFGNLRSLKNLSLANNQIRCFPHTFKRLSLDKFDASNNNFISYCPVVKMNKLQTVPTLEEIVAKNVLKYRIKYTKKDLTHFCINYLNEGRECAGCSDYCFRSFVYAISMLDCRKICDMMTQFESGTPWEAPIQVAICSHKCLRKSGVTLNL